MSVRFLFLLLAVTACSGEAFSVDPFADVGDGHGARIYDDAGPAWGGEAGSGGELPDYPSGGHGGGVDTGGAPATGGRGSAAGAAGSSGGEAGAGGDGAAVAAPDAGAAGQDAGAPQAEPCSEEGAKRCGMDYRGYHDVEICSGGTWTPYTLCSSQPLLAGCAEGRCLECPTDGVISEVKQRQCLDGMWLECVGGPFQDPTLAERCSELYVSRWTGTAWEYVVIAGVPSP